MRKQRDMKWLTLYRGISLKLLKFIFENVPFSGVVNHIPYLFNISRILELSITCSIKSGCLSNRNAIMKTLILCDNGSWDLTLFGRKIDLIFNRLEKYQCQTDISLKWEQYENVFAVVVHLKMCKGVVMNKNQYEQISYIIYFLEHCWTTKIKNI